MKHSSLYTFTLLISLIGLTGYEVSAKPVKHTSCGESKSIQQPKNSSGFYFDSQCETIYVLPPKKARMEVTAYAPTQSEQICNIVNNQIQALSNESEALTKKLNQIQNPPRRNLGPQAPKAPSVQCNKDIQTTASLRAKSESLSNKRDRLSSEVTSKEEQIASCSESCSLLKLELQNLKVQLKRVEDHELPKVRKNLAYYEQKVASCKEALEAIVEATPEVTQTAFEIQAQMDLLSSRLLTHLQNYGVLEGGVAQVYLENPHSELVEEFARLNPDYATAAMPASMSLDFSIRVRDSLTIPALISHSIPGLQSNLVPALAESDSDIAHNVFGASAAGQIILSSIAACALMDASTPSANNQSVQLVANVTYRYHLQSGRRYSVSYKLDEIMERIKKNSSRGGLFRTSSSSKITNFNKSDETISVEVDSDDSRLSFDSTEIASIKQSVLDRVLAQVARAYLPDSKTAVKLDTPETSEAAAPGIAKALRKCTSKYCQAGAIVLDLGHKLFGGSDSVASWRRENHVNNNQTFNETQMLEEFGSFAFVAEGW